MPRRVLPFLALASAARLQAQEPSPPATRDTTQAQLVDTIVVTGRYDDLIGIATSASQGRVGAVDLRLRPITREGELLETVPGLIVTQHSGDGKANQYFPPTRTGRDIPTSTSSSPSWWTISTTGWGCTTASWGTSAAPVGRSFAR